MPRWRWPLFAVLVTGPSMAPDAARRRRRAGPPRRPRRPARRRGGGRLPVAGRTCWSSSARSVPQDGGWWLRGRQRLRHRRLPGVRRRRRRGRVVLRYWPRPGRSVGRRTMLADIRVTPASPAGLRRSAPSRPHPVARRRLESPCPRSPLTDPVFDAAPRRQDGRRVDRAAVQPRGSVAGLHPRRGPGLRGDRRRPERWCDDYTWVGAHRRGGHRRLGRARPGQHRPAGRACR